MKHFAWNDLRDIVTVQGRTWEHEDNLYFNWSSSGFTVRFRGSALLAEFSAQSSEEYDGIPGDPNTPHRTVWPWISVFVDDNDQPCRTFELTNKSTKYLKYLGQMDLNLKSPLVWDFYKKTLQKLAGYGAAIIRLDAFAYAPKAPGSHNFMNEPETWNTLERVRELAAPYGLTLLPEIHASYEEKTYEKVANYGYLTYDFFLPGLLIDAIEQKDGTALAGWANELIEKHIVTVNMLGCHDGIPLLDLRGLLPEERIAGLIDLIIARGGFVKNLHGQKNVYYQVNATYYSALGEDDRKMLVARAVQLFMPGKPQVWYLDLFAGKNDHEAVAKAGEGGHKEINRTNLTVEQIHSALTQDVVKKQIELLRFRKSSRAFTSNAKISVISNKNNMHFIWQGNTTAELSVDFTTMSYEVKENGYIMMKG